MGDVETVVIRKAVGVGLDFSICAVFLLIAAVMATGGTTVRIASFTVGLHSPDNLFVLSLVLLCVRYFLRNWSPLFGCHVWPVDRLVSGARHSTISVDSWLNSLDEMTCYRYVALLLAVAIGVKIANAWISPGFYSGDDVEIQEMTISALRGLSWPIWDLRSPIYPFLVIYPAQYITYHLGWSNASTLVFVGRAAVAVLSSIVIWGSFLLARTSRGTSFGYALAAAFFLTTNKLQMAFGSSELPRPVATVLVLLACLTILWQRRESYTVTAGALLGFAGSFRFSENIFIVPACLHFCVHKQWRQAATVVASWLAVSLALAALGDRLYWGEPFHSLRAAWDYTVLRGLSSRGYQHALWYPAHVPSWTNPAVAVLAVIGTLGRPLIALWAWSPVVILSVLPHKEARYLIPITPFLCVLAAEGLAKVVQWMKRSSMERAAQVALVTLILTVLGTLHDMAHWRLPRSNADVALARILEKYAPRSLAIEQAWRLGGHLYLSISEIVDLDPADVNTTAYLLDKSHGSDWIVLDQRTLLRQPEIRTEYSELTIPQNRSAYRVWVRTPMGGGAK